MSRPDEGLIHAWLDGELDAAEAARVEALVRSDPAWAEAAAEARGFIAASSRILGTLDDVPARVLPKPSQRAPRRGTPWWMVRAAAVVVIIAGTVTVLRRSPNAPTLQQVAADAEVPGAVDAQKAAAPTEAAAAARAATPPAAPAAILATPQSSVAATTPTAQSKAAEKVATAAVAQQSQRGSQQQSQRSSQQQSQDAGVPTPQVIVASPVGSRPSVAPPPAPAAAPPAAGGGARDAAANTARQAVTGVSPQANAPAKLADERRATAAAPSPAVSTGASEMAGAMSLKARADASPVACYREITPASAADTAVHRVVLTSDSTAVPVAAPAMARSEAQFRGATPGPSSMVVRGDTLFLGAANGRMRAALRVACPHE